MRVGISVNTIIEVDDLDKADWLASMFAGYVDGVLSRTVDSFTAAISYQFNEPRHVGNMVKLDAAAKASQEGEDNV